MKKSLFTVALVFAIIVLTGCSKEEAITSSQPSSVYVERNDIAYEKSETEESETTSIAPSEETQSPSTNTAGDNNTPSANEDNQKLPDGIYETTIPDTAITDASFGDIKVSNNSYSTDGDNTIYGGISTEIRLGENNYGSWRYVLFGNKEFLPMRGEEYRRTVLVDNSETDGLSFAFNGAAHAFDDKEDEQASIFLEIEEESGVASAKRAAIINTPEAFASTVKGISTVLGEFNSVDSRGHAAYYPTMDVEYKIVTSKGEYFLKVGCPYQELVDILGEGTIISDDNNTYYAYKTESYTLVVEKTEYPDIKPSEELVELGISDNTVLISSIYLIKNQAELPTQPSEE